MAAPAPADPAAAGVSLDSPRATPPRGAVIALVAVAFVALMVLLNGAPWAVRSTATAAASANEATFDAAGFVEENWDSKVVPTADERADDLGEVLTALAADPDAAAEEYGYTKGSGRPHFIVQGTAVVTAVDATKQYGLATLQVPGAAGTVTVEVGPVLRGTVIRDAFEFIQIDQFANQIEYAKVAQALNTRVSESLAGIDLASLQGKTVQVTGAFAMPSAADVVITPVALELGDGAGA